MATGWAMGQKLTWFVLGAVVASVIWIALLGARNAQWLDAILTGGR